MGISILIGCSIDEVFSLVLPSQLSLVTIFEDPCIKISKFSMRNLELPLFLVK